MDDFEHQQEPAPERVTADESKTGPGGDADLAVIENVTRSPIAFTRLPFHQLSKKGRIDIRIMQRQRSGGQIELYWKVSPNGDYGAPGPLAYKLDTLVISGRLDEIGKPLPRIMRLGSLREIGRRLGIAESDTDTVKHALRQNALAGITAKLRYRTEEGRDETIDTTFTRYNVVFKGGDLQGTKAETVYLIFNDPYYGVLQESPRRPLDRDYLRVLTPGAQRFYEILSFEMFAALKYGHPRAKLVYSKYCAIAPQVRYYNRQPVQNQMNGLHKPHVLSGYIAKAVRYERVTDQEGQPDWLVFYAPGPKAKAEYSAFQRGAKRERHATALIVPVASGVEEAVSTRPPKPVRVDLALVAELTRRGVSESGAFRLLERLPESQRVRDQIEWADHLVGTDPGKFSNPPGLYVQLIRDNTVPPDTFETSSRRTMRQASAEAQGRDKKERFELEEAYASYRNEAVENHLRKTYTSEQYQAKLVETADELRSRSRILSGLGDAGLAAAAARHVRGKIARTLPLLTREEFEAKERRGKAPLPPTPVTA